MILFLYGEDTYRLKQKIKEMKEKYISASLGDTNLVVLEGKTVEYNEISRQVLAFPFLAKSRLVIIENLIKESKKDIVEKVIELLPKVPESTILVFVEEGKPDKRTALFKKLSKEKAQEFVPFDEIELNRWIQKEVEERGGTIEPDAIAKLTEYVGNDLWRLANEIDKLTAYSQNLANSGQPTADSLENKKTKKPLAVGREPLAKISSEAIEILVRPQIESNVFNLIDSVGAKNQQQSLRELHQLLDAGQNELYILSMIVYQFRNLLIVRDFIERGTSNQWDIAKKAGLHPFVAGKTLNLARNYSIDSLKNIYSTLLEQDIAIKTGQIDPKTALDLLVIKLCG